MNSYSTYFSTKCPSNGQFICYHLEISTSAVIMVEAIQRAIKELPTVSYHEDNADLLASMLGGRQILRAHHHGVDIETVRGDA